MGGTCCTTRDKANGENAPNGSTSGGLNEIQKSLAHINSYLEKSIFVVVNNIIFRQRGLGFSALLL